MSDPVFPTVFALQSYGNNRTPVNYIVITSQPVDPQIVTAAWSYAVRYTAKGIDLPDYDAAVEMMLKRHPSWKAVKSQVHSIGVNLAYADKDEPEAR
jgi:hypothetical protein